MHSSKDILISTVYAESLFRLALKVDKNKVLSLFQQASSLLLNSSSLQLFFTSSISALSDKKKFLDSLFQKLSSDDNVDAIRLLYAFFQTVLLHHRETILSCIVEAVGKRFDESEGRYYAEVTVPKDISLDKIEPYLLKMVRSEYKKFGLRDKNSVIIFSKKVSTSIVGSFCMDLQGYSLDLSFASYFKGWKKRLEYSLS